MHLGYHGGLCCGIKTIRGLGTNPDDKLAFERTADDPNLTAPMDGCHSNRQFKESFYRDAAPFETLLERFDRYLDFLKDERPGGVVEVVLADYKGDRDHSHSQLRWEPLLLERGFRLVTKCFNSNSDNYIYIYHLAMEPDNKKSEQPF